MILILGNLVVNKFSMSDQNVLCLLRELGLLCLQQNILFRARHIPGLDNKMVLIHSGQGFVVWHQKQTLQQQQWQPRCGGVDGKGIAAGRGFTCSID